MQLNLKYSMDVNRREFIRVAVQSGAFTSIGLFSACGGGEGNYLTEEVFFSGSLNEFPEHINNSSCNAWLESRDYGNTALLLSRH